MLKQFHSKKLLTHIFIICLFVLISVSFYWYVSILKTETIKTNAINSAKTYITILNELRNTYTSEVVIPAKHMGINISHNYQETENALPLPATFSMMLGKKIGKRKEIGQARLYSPYPFPWRSFTGGVTDTFEINAWQAFQLDSSSHFFEFKFSDTQNNLRYAIADVLREECVNCHNTHPDTPKKGWKTGDVRGVLEVNIPLDKVIQQVESETKGLFFTLMSSILLAYLSIIFMVHKFRSNSATLEEQVSEKTTALNHQVDIRKSTEQTLVRRNSELESHQLKLTHAIELSKQADIAKNNFLANVSHELRTPLNGISGMCQLLKTDPLTKRQEEYLDLVISSVNDEVKIIDDILNIAQLENSSYIVQQHSFDLIALLNYEISIHKKKSELKGVTLHPLHTQDKISDTLIGDSKIIHHIIGAFLDNAIKFTEHGSISTQLNIIEETDNKVTIKISVIDTGIGIREQDMKNVFNMFLQADNSSSRQHGGTGLGLAISKQLAGLINATVGVESEVDKGSSFWLITTLKTSPDSSELNH